MSKRHSHAERCLIAISAQLCLNSVRDENFGLWLDALRDVVPDCEACVLALAPLRASAQALIAAKAGPARDNALSRLRVEVRSYYQLAASHLYESWNDARQSEVAE